MPKDRRRSNGGAYKHSPSARPSKRTFTIQGGNDILEHVETGAMAGASAAEILAAINNDSATAAKTDPVPQAATKKEKQQLKHEAFLTRLGAPTTPYGRTTHSKSYNRRLKRKAKESLIADLADMTAAIDDLASDQVYDVTPQAEKTMDTDDAAQPRSKVKAGQIGESKKSTLTAAQRKRVLQTERQRQPLIMANPAFSSNPFETIRVHAENTLVKHQPTPKSQPAPS